MVLTIVPAVGGHPLSTLLRSHAAGLALGALVAALTLALLGAGLQAVLPQSGAALLMAIGILAIAWLPRTAGGRRGLRWPRRTWQVPEQWRYTMPMPVTLFCFGVLLGLGVLTMPVLPVLWVLVALTVVAASAPVAVAAWLSYALARWFMTVRESKRVVASGVIPDNVHGARGLDVARALGVLALLGAGALGAMAFQSTVL
jgi:hypothetical protein